MRFGERTRTGEPLSGFGRRPYVAPPLTVDYLVVAGGGGGGSHVGGGGGAGGYRTNVSGATSGGNSSAEESFVGLVGTSYTVTVGSGGSGGASDNRGSVGQDSVFGTTTSLGGGGGGTWQGVGNDNRHCWRFGWWCWWRQLCR